MTDKLNKTLNEAYTRIGDLTRNDFEDQLNADERLAFHVLNFHGQVCNGGFMQWYDNDYGTPAVRDFLVRLCRRLDTEASRRVAEMIEETAEIHRVYSRRLEDSRYNGEEDQDLVDAFYTKLDPFDTEYYKINMNFLADVEASL